MPEPTILIPFGESISEDSIFVKVELDDTANVDENDEVLTEFLDTEIVNILVHTEPGAIIEDISTSKGSITNAYSPAIVSRQNEIEEVAFKGAGDTYTLPHYPSGAVSIEWIGRQRAVAMKGRDIICQAGAGMCNISYNYRANQYKLQMDSLGLEQGEDFPVEVSYKVERG